jgi:F-type H+-transporting ATPase subunit delta
VKPTRIAGRYARALFEVSLREADPRAVEQQLETLVELLDTQPLLRKVLLNPVIPMARKQAVMADIAARLAFAPVLARLVGVLAERGALAIVPDLHKRYRQRLMDHLGIVRAEVTTAVELGDDRRDALCRSLEAVTGKDVTMVARVDPAIIGGVVAKVGSTVYDGSVTRQLERIREKMIEGTSG